MKSNRILVGAVLTAGLGLTGVVAASSSGASTPDSAASSGAVASVASRAASGASTTAVTSVGAGSAPVLTRVGKPSSGPVVVCSVIRAPGGAKPGTPGGPGTLPLPKQGKGLPLPDPGQKPVRITVKVVDGKVYVNGKRVPGAKVGKDCPAPPALPPLPGGLTGKGGGKAGGVVLQGAPGGAEAGLTTSTLRG
ncbi:hypothetical protein [Actinacidiphila rubida]|uniref:Uncharacterized protein n=1 Tax=Actinacidiphila rubida TaxID=310780 RepID=A0A1H8NS53_9ACTN|nr:hypothetical protein [Actinacidiphila rubida]SEO32454.1 hypothetical protein SAMN05216267_102364 [Actinacidiphila rubida]